MSVEFLKNFYAELLQEKSELELEQNHILLKLKENEKCMEKFKKEEEENYDAFSPRNQNTDLRKSIDSFEKEKSLLLQKNQEISIKLNELDEKIVGFDSVFQEDREVKNSFEKSTKQKKKLRKIQKNYRRNLSDIISKLEFCNQLIDLDPVRCKLELSSLLKILYKRMDDNYMDEQEISNKDEGAE